MKPPTNQLAQLEAMVNELGLAEVAASLNISVRTPTDVALDEFITDDPDLIEVKAKVRKLAMSEIPILVIGETGTGKELIAKALHGSRKGNFVAINCAGIPDTLLEAEFFGAKKGAFTGCNDDRRGLIDESAEGTLFLDEIGDMPILLQSKLLRCLQSKTYRRVGDTHERKFTARLVAATNISEADLKSGKRFRSDLYYRLAGYVIQLKPLRSRPESDIDNIVRKFATNPNVVEYEQQNRPALGYQGNVRELLNIIKAQNILRQ